MFEQIRWIGGSPCAGKSSISEVLARLYSFQLYHCDAALERHQQAITAEAQPTMHRLIQMSWDALWTRPVARQVAEEQAFYAEEFPFILRDLAVAAATPMIVEGTALLPELIAPLLDHPRQAIWLVPTPTFQVDHYRQRPWVAPLLEHCTDPVQAFSNWMARDVQFADMVEARCNQRGLRVLRIDGTQTITDLVDEVADWLQLPLQPHLSSCL